MPPPVRVIVWSKPDCPLCDELLADLAAVGAAAGVALHVETRNILDNAADFARFRHLIPVMEVAGGPLLYPPHEWARLRAEITRAAPVASAATHEPD